MSRKLIVIGAGGHAKVLIDALLTRAANVVGLTDNDPSKAGTSVLGIPVIGDDRAIDRLLPAEVILVNGIGSVGRPDLRRQIFEAFKARGYEFATVQHPSAIVSPHAQMLEGVQLMAGSVVQAGAAIGCNSIVNTKASVDHDCKVGAHVHIAPGVTLSGNVEIADNVHVGANSTILQNIHIGAGCVIGAGTVVVRNLPSNANVCGVPARNIET